MALSLGELVEIEASLEWTCTFFETEGKSDRLLEIVRKEIRNRFSKIGGNPNGKNECKILKI